MAGGTGAAIPLRMPLTAAAQVVGVAMILGICLLVPRANGPVLLVRLAGDAEITGAILAESRLTLIGAGPVPGSLIVQAGGKLPVLDFLRRGIVPVNAAGRLCRPSV